jgi:site-specific recombinase XerD
MPNGLVFPREGRDLDLIGGIVRSVPPLSTAENGKMECEGYLRNGRPKSSCRRLFIRTLAPHVGFASGCAITMIAKAALDRVGIKDCAHRGAHIFRHSLATELLRSGATLTEIGQLLRHKSHDTTRIYAKVDIEALRTLSLPWPGSAQ